MFVVTSMVGWVMIPIRTWHPSPARRHDMSREEARRWYQAGVLLSILALIAMVVSTFAPRIGQSVAFCLTLGGFLAVSRPAWDVQGVRLKALGMSVGVFATEFAM